MAFVRLVSAWLLSMALYAAIIQGWHAAKGQPTSGFGSHILEIIMGLGVLLAIPTFLFALVVGWPTMAWLAQLRTGWLLPLVASAIFALVMWVLTKIMLPNGWVGVEQTLIGYAAVLGLVWGCINIAATPAG